MLIYKFNKPFLRHIMFFYLELKSAIFSKYHVRGNLKFIKRLYVRLIVNYIESFNYYFSKIFEKNKTEINKTKKLDININGVEFLKNVDLNSIDFLKINNNKDKNQITSKNEINFKKGEIFAKNLGFHNLAKNYLNTSSCNFFISSWNTFSFKNDDELKTGLWHRDRDGIKLLKFFIYLSDVDETTGPHYFISGSHKKKPLRFVPQFRYEDIKIREYYNENEILKIVGSKGTCFMEDTTGIHRGSRPYFEKYRSILSYSYFTGPLYYEENCKLINLN